MTHASDFRTASPSVPRRLFEGVLDLYRPVIAGAKLREGTTHDLAKRGRALQGVAMSSMRFHHTGRGHEDDKDGQETWFTARIASLIG